MSFLFIKNPSSGYTVPDGTIALWWGTAASIPEGWSVYSAASGVFVKCAAAVNLTPSGTLTHKHSNPSSTGSVANHTHSTSNRTNSSTVSATSGKNPYGTWLAVKSHSHPAPVSTFESTGGHSHTLLDTEYADLYPPYKCLYHIQCTGKQALPIGSVIMFADDYANRPRGFNLCDGGSYSGMQTVDLRSRFVFGVDESHAIGDSGGSETHVHTQSLTEKAGRHQHYLTGGAGSSTGVNVYQVGGGGTSAASGNHSHTWNTYTDYDAHHQHSVPDTSAESHLPEYIKLYYLMRTQ